VSAEPTAELTATQLAQARAALDRGDYGQVVRLLLTPEQASAGGAGPLRDPELLLLLATAWMGQGRSDDALACCRRLRGCADPSLRVQARELQRVLEAPVLQRPRDWSLTLPDLAGSDVAMGRQLGPLRRRSRQRPAPPPAPPVGPTRAPLGFALVVVVLVLLGLLLGGCGAAHTELHFAGPGRLQLSEHLQLQGPAPTPWQRRLSANLQRQGFSQSQQGPELVLRGPVLPSQQALDQLGQAMAQAAAQADLDLPPPQLHLHSRNWLVAVDERYDLDFDLRRLGPWSSLDLALELNALPLRAVKLADPQPVQPRRSGSGLVWALQGGSNNRLVLHLWRWNPLGLGAVLVVLVLVLSLALQHLRRLLGFGLPELPG
jgi:hypothetical protein